LTDHDFGVLAQGVTRRFGSVKALDGLDLTAPYGQVTALVGPNGAGKTTLMLVLATLLRADDGEVRVAGFDPVTHPDAVRASMGWMPDVFGVYDQLTVREYLAFFADAYLLGRTRAKARVADLLDLVHLDGYADRPVHVLSRGQKQRLALARALVHEPPVLLLDEPASGLDPRSRVELRDTLRAEAAEGRSVLISSHILTELEEVADRVVFVAGGRTAGEEDMADIGRESAVVWRIRAADPAALDEALAECGIHPEAVTDAGTDLAPMTDDEAADLLASLVADGVRVVSFGPVGSHLESAYLAMSQERL
jgi:ABC-2 type transport system ATP-binding protein